MAARVIDGKAVAAAVKERVKVDLAAYEEESGAHAGAGDGAGRRGPGLRGLRRDEGQSLRARSGSGRSTSSPDAAIRQEELEELVRGAERRRRRSTGSSSSCRCPTTSTPTAIVALIDPAKDVDGLTPVNAGLLAHGTPGPRRPARPPG